MSTVKSSKIDQAPDPKDIICPLEFKGKLLGLYSNEFNEILEKILVKSEGDFMRTLTHRVRVSLSEKYSDDIFENIALTTAIKTTEKDIYLNVYKDVYPKCKKLQSEAKQMPQSPFGVLKHCNYQSNTILHRCPNGTKTTSFALNEEFILCKTCDYVYKISCVKLFCDFCSVDFYTTVNTRIGITTKPITNHDSNNNIEKYQPATWEKYHCNIVFNDQMRCIECKEKLVLDIPNNKILCLNCGFNSDPLDILWRCMVCSSEFKSNAKIYNPLEYKTIKNTIKNALIEKEYARPLIFACTHDKAVEKFNHKSDCDGILYIGYYNETKMIICSKCSIVTLYERYIWKCPICNKRFRDKEKALLNSSLNLEDNDVNSLNSSTNDSGNVIEKKRSSSIIASNEDSSSLLPQNDIKTVNVNHGFIKVSIDKMPKLVLKQKMTKIDFTDLSIISQITEGTVIKVYAVRNGSKRFYALKRQPYTTEAINNCIIQSSIKFSGITAIKGIHINEDSNELNVLEELGICDLEKEIISRRRIKKYYTELELLNMIYQLSLSLSYLQHNGYVHCNICTNNIILFKDGIFKLSGFSSLRKIGEMAKDKTSNEEGFELIKSDAFDLGLTMLYTSCFIEQSIEDVIAIDQSISDVNKSNDKIKEIVEANLLKLGRYSEQYIKLVLSLLNSDLIERFDFFDVTNYITSHFSSSK